MAKLYYKFGAMGSSKTASALMCRFNYLQKGISVLLLKPKLDTRSKENEVTSRIGLTAPCVSFAENESIADLFAAANEKEKVEVVIVDECQFCTKKQIDQLREIAESVPVLCYGLKTNFKGELFEGSKRLLEVSDSIQEVKSVCECGKKAIMNGRFVKGLIVTEGEEVVIGGDEKYRSLCWSCFKKEQNKALIYQKIIKYLKIFDNMDSAGDWSGDTAIDNIVMHTPHVIYDEEVQNFINDFKTFQIKDPQKVLLIDDNIATLRKIPMKDKNFDYMMNLISYALKLEKIKPGLLKTLIEEGTVTKWLRQIKKCVG